ncbi:hypothetical protein [Gordonia iterans]
MAEREEFREAAQQRSTRAHRNVDEATEARIRQCHADGMSLRATAREIGMSPSVLSRWSKRAGVSWLPVPAVAATAAERHRARRQALAESLLTDAENLRKRLWENDIQHFATKDGVERAETELPTARAVSDYSAAVERMVRSADHLSGDGPAVEHERTMLGRLHEQIRRTVSGEP